VAARQQAEYTVRSAAPPGLQEGLIGVAARADELPEVDAARVVTYADLRITDETTEGTKTLGVSGSAFVVDPAVVARFFDVTERAGDLAGLGDGEIAVRDAVAEAHGWEIGDRLLVQLPDATERELVLAGRFEGGIATNWVLPPETVEGHTPAAYREVFVDLGDGVDVAAVRPDLERIVAGTPTAELQSRDDKAAEMVEANEGTLGILTALFALSLVIGGLGVVNTLTLVIHERVREIGLLRAIGATRGQVRSVIRWEAVLTTSLGALLGAGLGLLGAWVAVAAMPGSPAVTIPGAHLGVAMLATILLGVIASVIPAARAARLDVLDALRAT
jgi:putative ABC transport system permease protein